MIRGEKCSLEINTFEEDVSGSFTKKKHKLQLGGKKPFDDHLSIYDKKWKVTISKYKFLKI